MPGLIINGREVAVPGLTVLNWKDNPLYRVKLGEDGRARRTSWVRSLYVHSTKGIPGGKDKRPQVILPGLGPDAKAEDRAARWWSNPQSGSAGAHVVLDHDASAACFADLQTEVTFHATSANEYSIGIEVYQGADAEFYEQQLDAVVLLIDTLTFLFGIQRQIHLPYRAYNPVDRLNAGGKDCVGVFGHRDQTSGRGPGDPGDWLAERLLAAGYEAFNFQKRADLAAWVERQHALGVEADGIPGPKTVEALRASGHGSPYPSGLWVQRPIDADLHERYVAAAQPCEPDEALAAAFAPSGDEVDEFGKLLASAEQDPVGEVVVTPSKGRPRSKR